MQIIFALACRTHTWGEICLTLTQHTMAIHTTTQIYASSAQHAGSTQETLQNSSPHRAYQGIFVGYRSNSNTPLVYVPSQDKVFASGDVHFDEHRQESLLPSVSTSERYHQDDSEPSLDPHTKLSKPKHFESPTDQTEPLTNTNDDQFIETAAKNIQNFHFGSEPIAV